MSFRYECIKMVSQEARKVIWIWIESSVNVKNSTGKVLVRCESCVRTVVIVFVGGPMSDVSPESGPVKG